MHLYCANDNVLNVFVLEFSFDLIEVVMSCWADELGMYLQKLTIQGQIYMEESANSPMIESGERTIGKRKDCWDDAASRPSIPIPGPPILAAPK